MNIVLATSEVVPFSKTGGLADVCGALPAELAKLGHEVSVIAPAYRSIWQSQRPIDITPVRFAIPVGKKIVEGGLLRSTLPNSEVAVYLVDQPGYFDRPALYGHGSEDFSDNCERFAFFCRAVMEAIPALNLTPDVLHCNDWQTGLLPALYQTDFRQRPNYPPVATVLTIHNLAYQGSFWHWDMLLTGIDWRHFNWREMEFYGRLNLLKTGIVFADAITTVSPRYAEEIQTYEYGCGLEGVLRHRSGDLFGILNGIDQAEWDPASDPALAARYDATTWRTGKAACKQALQQELRLRPSSSTPLIGSIGRLASQKGWVLILPVMEKWLAQSDAQWVVLGSGDWEYHQALEELARRHPGKLAARLEFSNDLAHRIEAAADMFLMPSRYEPCGLNQMYSLRYGTLPIVFHTGGLADTVVDANSDDVGSGASNGFSFREFTADALHATLQRAVATYNDHPGLWGQMVVRGMPQDWSWSQSAQRYQEVYRRVLAARSSARVN
jgi:starch synthase